MPATSLETHFRALSVSAKTLRLYTQLRFEDLSVEVSGTDRYVELTPEFAALGPNGALECSEEVLPQSRVFTGWRSGPKQPCELSRDKRAFAAFCAHRQVRTPRIYARPTDATTNVVVKQNRPAMRGVIRGPFAPGAVPTECLRAPSEVILQEFVPGHMLQAWYWDGLLFAVEIRNRPHVVGDGLTPVRELIQCSSFSVDWIDWIAAEDALRFQGESLDTILPAGKKIAVDIRFSSALQPFLPVDVLTSVIGTPVHAQLLRAGPVFRKAIPEPARRHTQFVLGAIIDSQRRLWFTDMATDLPIHPDGYDLMLRGLFGIPLPAPPAEMSRTATPATSRATS